VVATDAEVKDNKAGNGKFIAFTFEVTTGQFANRKLWHNLTILHTASQQAQEIGQRTLKQFAEAINHPDPNHIKGTNEFLNKPVKVKVAIQPDKGYGEKNEIKFFNPVHTGSVAATPAAAAAAPAKTRAINPFAD
jgi:hypothetical protein